MSSSVSKTFLVYAVPSALALVGVIYAGMEFRHYLLSSPRFAVNSVEILSTGIADKASLLKIAAIPKNANIFSLDLDQIRRNIEKDPWVYSATVMRSLPNNIQIQYTQQKAVAILGGETLRYVNREGDAFYSLKKGDSLKYPLLQAEGSATEEVQRERLARALDLLFALRESKLFTDEDLGDFTVRLSSEDGAAPFALTLRYPPVALVQKDKGKRLYTAIFAEEDIPQQIGRWEAVVRHLLQLNKSPKLLRLELGKKVVVKLER